MNKIWGYARVSTKEQNLDRQIAAIKQYCPEIKDEEIYKDKKSGKNFDREAYIEMKKVLREGDTLIIKDIERLGRNKEMAKNELNWLKQKGVRLKILNIPTTLQDLEENSWIMDMITTILIEVYTSLAEQDYLERREKVKEGIAIAKEKGAFKGRKPKGIDKKVFVGYYKRIKQGGIQKREVAELLGIPRQTLDRKIKEYEEGNADKWLE